MNATLESLERRTLLNAGTLDAAFGDGGAVSIPIDATDVRVRDVAVMRDGRIVVVGSTTADGTLTVLRLRPDGSFDPTFGDNGRATSQIGAAQALAVDLMPDDKIVVAGQRGTDCFLLRYRTNGKHDRTFGDGGLVRGRFANSVSSALDVEVLDDGAILVAGNATQANASTAVALAKFDEDGQLVPAFGGIDDTVVGGLGDGTIVTKFGFALNDEQSVSVERMTLGPGGDILLAGQFRPGGLGSTTDSDVAVMRFDPAGIPDEDFGRDGLFLADFGGAGERATGVDVDAQDRPVVSVDVVFGVLRLLPGGRRDLSFGTNGLVRASGNPGFATDVLVDDAGRSVIGGEINDTPRVVRLLPNGARDPDFGSNGLTSPAVPFGRGGEIMRLVESPDNTYLVAGRFVNAGSAGRAIGLAKYFADDTTTATLIAAALTSARTGSYEFRVRWRDPDGIDVTTLGPGDIRVTGPGGYARTATLITVPTSADPTDVLARYKVPPPDGSDWSASDNGAYSVFVLPDAVFDALGTPVEPDLLGMFRVEIA